MSIVDVNTKHPPIIPTGISRLGSFLLKVIGLLLLVQTTGCASFTGHAIVKHVSYHQVEAVEDLMVSPETGDMFLKVRLSRIKDFVFLPVSVDEKTKMPIGQSGRVGLGKNNPCLLKSLRHSLEFKPGKGLPDPGILKDFPGPGTLKGTSLWGKSWKIELYSVGLKTWQGRVFKWLLPFTIAWDIATAPVQLVVILTLLAFE